jgi:hypothetical protein
MKNMLKRKEIEIKGRYHLLCRKNKSKFPNNEIFSIEEIETKI